MDTFILHSQNLNNDNNEKEESSFKENIFKVVQAEQDNRRQNMLMHSQHMLCKLTFIQIYR